MPFVGRLGECSSDDLLEAGKEVLVATLFSTMPLWLLPLLSAIVFVNSVSTFDAVKTGELFLFSTALVGPLVYIIGKNYSVEDSSKKPLGFLQSSIRFPYGQGFVWFCIAICLISSVVFILLRNPLFSQGDLAKIINYDGVITLSLGCFTISILVFFCATAYRNSLDNVVRAMPKQEAEFSRQWEESRDN